MDGPQRIFHDFLMLANRASRDIKCHYLNGSRNRDISFLSSSFAGGILFLLGVGLSASSDMVSAITPSLLTCPSRREAPSEVGIFVDFVAILLNGVDKVEQISDFLRASAGRPSESMAHTGTIQGMEGEWCLILWNIL